MAWVWPGIRRAPSLDRMIETIDVSLDRLARALRTPASVAGITGVTGAGLGLGGLGTAVLNFGAFPGTDVATVVVTGQSKIVAESIVMASIRPVATADHSADEHMLEQLEVVARDIVVGTGFTLYGVSQAPHLLWGQWNVSWLWL